MHFARRNTLIGKSLVFERLESKQLLTTLVDLDGDADLDILWHDSWYENVSGQGHFERHKLDPAREIIAADLDGDDDLDLATTNGQWLENIGNGEFTAHDLLGFDGTNATRIRTTDQNLDGIIDLVLITRDAATVFRNTDGRGAFSLLNTLAASGIQDAGDIDADGDIDLVTRSTSGVVSVRWNTNGFFESQEVFRNVDSRDEFGNEFRHSYSTASLVQLDSDANLELSAVDHWFSKDWIIGEITGGDAQVWWDFTANGIERKYLPGGCDVQGVSEFHGSYGLTDWDRDGAADSWCRSNILVELYQNDGSGKFTTETIYPPSQISVEDVGDINSDGVLDVLSWERTPVSLLPIWLDGKSGTMQKQTEPRLFAEDAIYFGADQLHSSVELVDLKNNGQLKAVIVNSNGVEVWNFSNDELQPQMDQQFAIAMAQRTATADIDNDGDLDVAVATSGFNRILINENGWLIDGGQILGNSETTDLVFGDFDFDGDLDLFAANTHGQPDRIWKNNGDGQFSDAGQALGNSNSNCAVIFDLYLDGDLDVLVCSTNQPAVQWENHGDATFTSAEIGDTRDLQDIVLALGNAPGRFVSLVQDVRFEGALTEQSQGIWTTQGKHAAWGDVNNDGAFDLVVANQFEGVGNRIWFIPAKGPTGYVPHMYQLGTGKSQDVALGDIDQDGDLDVVFANDGQNSLFINQTNPNRPPETPLLPDPPSVRFDDHGNTDADATRIISPVPNLPTVITAEINFSGDADVFSVELSAGVTYDVFMAEGEARLRGISGDRARITPEINQTLFIQISGDPGPYAFEIHSGEALHVPGDANRDGVFNSADLVQVFQAAQFDDGIPNNSSWETGDWNGDEEFDTEDFVFAFSSGAYSE